MSNAHAADRLTKNIVDANRLIELLSSKVAKYNKVENVNYGHVGDVFQVRKVLSELLDEELIKLD
jgi:acetylglutamate kinase